MATITTILHCTILHNLNEEGVSHALYWLSFVSCA